MSTDVSSALATIAALDDRIDSLQDARGSLTSPLEQAARRYYRANPSRGGLGCARCYFVYSGTRNRQETVSFSTDCSWCGKDSGKGLRVSAAELAKYLED